MKTTNAINRKLARQESDRQFALATLKQPQITSAKKAADAWWLLILVSAGLLLGGAAVIGTAKVILFILDKYHI